LIVQAALPVHEPSTPTTTQSPSDVVASAQKIRVMKDDKKISREISPNKITEAMF
jgi:hypothetical protein